MLTVLDFLSAAGERKKQNDDACGAAGGCAWVLDGATDLHDPPLTGSRSDAAWIAQLANRLLHARTSSGDEGHLRSTVRDISADVSKAYSLLVRNAPEHWMMPLASLLMVAEAPDGICGLDLGDCRCFAADQDGNALATGGPPLAADEESHLARQAANQAGGASLLQHAQTLLMLQRMRDAQNREGGAWTFCALPECADRARTWRLPLQRPAHVLICTDGFSALVDRYHAYDAGELVRAAIDRGLAGLARELRDIEAGDPLCRTHPRWKRSDDATAVLLRLE